MRSMPARACWAMVSTFASWRAGLRNSATQVGTARKMTSAMGWGIDERRDVGGEGQERAEADVVVQREPAAEGQDRDLGERRHRLQQRAVARLQPDAAHPGAVQDLDRIDHALQLAVFLPERLDDANAVG